MKRNLSSDFLSRLLVNGLMGIGAYAADLQLGSKKIRELRRQVKFKILSLNTRLMFLFAISISFNSFAGKFLRHGYLDSSYIKQITQFYSNNKRAMNEEERREFMALVQKGRFPLDQTNSYGESAIMFAAGANDLEIVRFLLNNKNINERNRHSETLLHLAASFGYIEIADLLINARADLDMQDRLGRTPIIVAAARRHPQIVKLLLDARANLQLLDHNGISALAFAAHEGHTEIVEMLLKAEDDLVPRNSPASTPFEEAPFQDEKSSLVQRDDLQVAVRCAAQEARAQVLQLLIDSRANITLPNKDGDTALILAASQGYAEIIRILLDAAADLSRDEDLEEARSPQKLFLDWQNSNRQTAIIAAAMGDHHQVVEQLIKAKANLDLPDRNGETALMWAAYKGHTKIVLMLLLAGANSTLRNRDALTALSQAHGQNQKMCETILRNWRTLSEGQQFKKFLEAKSEILLSLGEDFLLPAFTQFLKERGALLYAEDQVRYFRSKKMVSAKCFWCQYEHNLSEDELIGKGPSGCTCLVCPTCKPEFVRRELENCGTKNLNCPQCEMMLNPDFFKNAGCTKAEILKISVAITEQKCSQQPGWMYCKTPDCKTGTIVDETQSAFFSCPVCDFEGCLKCGENHRGDCRQAEGDQKAMESRMDFLLEQGALAPPEGGHPVDPNHPDYLRGRYRPCYFCGTIVEKSYDGTHHAGQCNGMVCPNPRCKKKWHWNYGDHRLHPDNADGMNEIHDFRLEQRNYKRQARPL